MDFERLNEDYYRQRQQRQEVTESLKRGDQVRRRVASLRKIDRDLKEIEGKRKHSLTGASESVPNWRNSRTKYSK